MRLNFSAKARQTKWFNEMPSSRAMSFADSLTVGDKRRGKLWERFIIWFSDLKTSIQLRFSALGRAAKLQPMETMYFFRMI